MKIFLTVTSGEFAGKKYSFEKKFIIGNSPKSDVVVDDESIAKKQVEISIKSNAVYIKDLKPSDNALLNGKAISDKNMLKSRDKIKVGNTTFELKILKQKKKSKAKEEPKETPATQHLGRTLSDIARTDTEPVNIEQVQVEVKLDKVEKPLKPVVETKSRSENIQDQAIEIVTKGREIKQTNQKRKLRERLGFLSMYYDEMSWWMKLAFATGIVIVALLLGQLGYTIFDTEAPEVTENVDGKIVFIPDTGQRIAWPPGSGYETAPKNNPLQPHNIILTYTECFITDFIDGKISAIGEIETREGKEAIIFPGAIATNLFGGAESIKIKDYNGDVCILPFGAKVEVTKFGGFKLLNDDVDDAEKEFEEMKKKLAELENSEENVPEDEE